MTWRLASGLRAKTSGDMGYSLNPRMRKPSQRLNNNNNNNNSPRIGRDYTLGYAGHHVKKSAGKASNRDDPHGHHSKQINWPAKGTRCVLFI